MLSQSDYEAYCKGFKSIENYLRKYSRDTDRVVSEICGARGYYPERMGDILRSAGFFFVEDTTCFEKLKKVRNVKDYGIFSEKGNFILEGRYIFPVRDMLGNTIALIGWFPDEKKYVTTPSKFFSKQCLFYGMEQIGKTGLGKHYYLVEGIFDCLSVRSLGLPCVAQMGITTSRYKQVMYSMFSSLTAIPDNDAEGREVIAYDKWKLPTNSRYFRWLGDNSKDIDKICNGYEAEDVIELLEGVRKERGKVITIRV